MDPETTTAPVTAPETPVTAPVVTEPSEVEKAEAARKAEIDRYRNEAGQAAKKAKDLEAEVQKLKDAQLSETERLQKEAEKVPALTQEMNTWKERAEKAEAQISEDVEARKKALPSELSCLMPDGTPSQQLAWIRNAEASAAKLKPKTGLPPSGGREPGSGAQNGEPTKEQREHAQAHYAGRF